MEGALQDRGRLRGIAATLLSLALLAERAAARSYPVRFLVLIILYRAEAVARAFVARAIETDCPEDLPCPDLPCPDWPYPDEPPAMRYSAADAAILTLRLRMLATVLDALAGADGGPDERSAGWSANLAPCAVGASGLPMILVVRLPTARRPLRPHDTS